MRINARSHESDEVMGADLVTLVQIQPVGRATVRPDAGVQVNLTAAQPYRFIVDPRQQLTSKPLATAGLNRRQVVDIDVSSPAQAGALPEPATDTASTSSP